jgi:hypothetical protein
VAFSDTPVATGGVQNNVAEVCVYFTSRFVGGFGAVINPIGAVAVPVPAALTAEIVKEV